MRHLKRLLYRLPGLRLAWLAGNRLIGRADPIQFRGWGMTTTTLPPWMGTPDDLTAAFLAAQRRMETRVGLGAVVLTQFADVPDPVEVVRELQWRHFVVFWSARMAVERGAGLLVECGVCDGLTAAYALAAAPAADAVLYDAWGEVALAAYHYLSLARTRDNLREDLGRCRFVEGLLPESLLSHAPQSIAWLHIDLNAAAPTAAVLEVLTPALQPGAIVLFDDYGWPGWRDTKTVVDRWASLQRGRLLPMPTGQAIWFHG